MSDRINLTIALADRYRLEDEIGRGGMATVFRARDLRHDRDVAVKVLRGDSDVESGADRFAREIKLVARLTHPNILPLYDSGAFDGGVYFVMPLMDGETLRTRLDRSRPMDLDEVIQFAIEAAHALDYAHRHGVVHRDVKPENILVHDGHAVVADFGIGKALSTSGDGGTLTQVGMLIGTPAYMSPEQAAGEDTIDGRSDLYSLGCVLYELVTGEQPFVGSTLQGVIAKRFMTTPPNVTVARPDAPSALARAIARLLVREPEGRFASGAELVAALRTTAKASGLAEPTIAVLPFVNMSADPDAEFFSDGMTEEILNALAKLTGLRVMARTSSFAFKNKNIDVRAIGERLGARYVLEGSVRKGGDRLRITAQLIDAVEGHHLWSDRYDRDMRDVFAVQDEITGAIRDALSERLLGIGPAPAPAVQRIDPATYESYLRGRYLSRRRMENLSDGVALLERVIQHAPAFAPAYLELAIAQKLRVFYCDARPRDVWPLVRDLSEKAAALDPHLGPAQYMLAEIAFYYEWDWPKARTLYERALHLTPNDPDTLASYGMFCASERRFAESLRVIANAVALDPLDPSVLLREYICLYLSRRFAAAIESSDRTIALVPEFPESYRWKGLAGLAMDCLDEAIVNLETSVERSGRHAWAVFDLGMAYIRAGRIDDALRLGAELRDRAARDEAVPTYALTLEAQAASPWDADAFFATLDRWYDERGFWLVMLAVEPTFDHARHDPRFVELARRVGIPVDRPQDVVAG